MKKFLAVVLMVWSVGCMAMTVYWSGRVEYVTTVTGKSAIKCWYNVGVNQRPVIFTAEELKTPYPQCPQSIEVE
jgi:hypothetical protein